MNEYRRDRHIFILSYRLVHVNYNLNLSLNLSRDKLFFKLEYQILHVFFKNANIICMLELVINSCKSVKIVVRNFLPCLTCASV